MRNIFYKTLSLLALVSSSAILIGCTTTARDARATVTPVYTAPRAPRVAAPKPQQPAPPTNPGDPY